MSLGIPLAATESTHHSVGHLRQNALLLGIASGFLVVTFVFARTQFEPSDLIWLVSVLVQVLFGFRLLRLLGISSDSPDLRILASVVLGVFTYSFSYQVLLLVLSPGATWVLSNGVMVVVVTSSVLRRRGLRDRRSLGDLFPSCAGHHSLVILGGGLCILGTSAQWTFVLPLGIGAVVAAWLSSSSTARGALPALAVMALLLGGAVSCGWSWYVGRLARGYWWVTSNDFQTTVAMAVSVSRFGMWDEIRLAGEANKYHWSISGWAGMTNPWGHPETEIGVFTMLVLGAGLFLAINAWVERIARSQAGSRTVPRSVLSAAVGSLMVGISWASQQTVLGLMAFACFALVFADAVTQKSPQTWVLLILLGAAAVWSNALTLPFLAVVVPVQLVVARRAGVQNTHGRGGWSLPWLVVLSSVLLAAGVVFWRFLFLPSARSGSFGPAFFANRDHLLPQFARLPHGPVLDELLSLAIYIFIEHVTIAVLVGLLLVVASEGRTTLTRSVTILFGGLACVTAGLVLAGPEMGKFASWGSFMCSVALATTLAIWISKHGLLARNRTIDVSAAIVGVSALIVPFLEQILLRNRFPVSTMSALYLHRLRILVGGFTLLLTVAGVAQTMVRKNRRNSVVRLLLVWITGMLVGHLASGLPDHVLDYRRDHRASPTFSLDLLASREVREVSDWLKLNTDEESIIASNYFCHVGETCPSDTTDSIQPSMWGLGNADMSNLAAYSERRFYIQAFRHVFGNHRMPELARVRVRETLDAANSGDLSTLRKAGVSYFVLDRASAPASSDRMTSALLFENSRFSVYSVD